MITLLPHRHGGPRALSIVVSSSLFLDRVAVADRNVSEKDTRDHGKFTRKRGARNV